MKKYQIITILLVLTLILAGCFGKPQLPVNQNTNQPVNQNTNINTTPTTTGEIDTSDWKTYRNEEYGFEFRYPKEWKSQLYGGPDPELNFGISFINSSRMEGVHVEVRGSLINEAIRRFCFFAIPLDHDRYLQFSCRENDNNNSSILEILASSLKIDSLLIDFEKIQTSVYYLDNDFMSVIIPDGWTFYSSYASSVKGSDDYSSVFINKIFKKEEDSSRKKSLWLKIITYNGSLDDFKQNLSKSGKLFDTSKLTTNDGKEFSVFVVFDSSSNEILSHHIFLTGKLGNVLINIFSTEDFDDIADDVKTILNTLVIK